VPELPEVETVRRSLAPLVAGREITKVTVRERRLRRPVPATFETRLRGQRFSAIERRGKYLLFELDCPQILLVHLGMSGSMQLRDNAAPALRHDHVIFELDRRESLCFNDPRRFGMVRLGTVDGLDELRNIGPDPMTMNRSVDEWRRQVRRRRTPIKTLLMNQTFLAGVGNIYANEILFQAGIRPRRMAARLTRDELGRLDAAIHSVLARAVELGGSSISDFRDVDGKPGYFQIHHAVYDRTGAACPKCDTSIRKITLGGRSTFYCRSCQQ